MGMPHVEQRWTVEMFRALPETNERQEIIDGEFVVTPTPRVAHQRFVMRLGRQLVDYVERHHLGEVFSVPVDVPIDRHTVLEPDMTVFGRGLTPADNWFELKERPILAVEVLSPSTARRDRGVKRAKYQAAGVTEYWIVDLDARLAERWRPGDERPEIAQRTLSWHPATAPEPLVIELPAFFSEVLGAG